MKNKILLALSILVGLMFLNSGLNKIFNYIPVPENLPEELMKDNAAFMEVSWLMPLVAITEIIGAILLMIPKTRTLGVIILLPILVGILLLHITVEPTGLPMAIVLTLFFLWLIYEHRKQYKSLIL